MAWILSDLGCYAESFGISTSFGSYLTVQYNKWSCLIEVIWVILGVYFIMLDGVFYLTFQSSMGVLGAGLAVLENGQIRGGDDSYLYSGWYKPEVNGVDFSGHVDVKYYQGDVGSIFGFLDSFQLNLSGSFTKGGLRAGGYVKGQPLYKMSLDGVRIEDAYSSLIPGKQSNNIKEDEFSLKDPFGLLNDANHQSFSTAVQLHTSSKYLDALKIMFPIIEAAVNGLLSKVGEKPESFNGLTRKTAALGNKNVIPHHIVHANEIVYARNKVLHGNYAPPDDYLYPLSLLAFRHLRSLLTECNFHP
jgi:T3SS negative regulator,GrlR